MIGSNFIQRQQKKDVQIQLKRSSPFDLNCMRMFVIIIKLMTIFKPSHINKSIEIHQFILFFWYHFKLIYGSMFVNKYLSYLKFNLFYV